jgi:hypothetical protein
MRRSLPLLPLFALAAGCAPPDYIPVGLQVDLQVTEDDDPFDTISGLRVCLTSDAGDAFYLFPRDPGAYLIPDVPADTVVSLEIHGLDREPDEIDLGEEPTVLAWAVLSDAVVASTGEGGAVDVDFGSCTDDCPADCSAPETLPVGESAIGLRKAPEG